MPDSSPDSVQMLRLTALVSALSVASGTSPRLAPDTLPDVAARATPPAAEELRRDLFAFAHDSMEGRETGTPGATRAARFIADRLAALGLRPAGDSGFFQRVPLTRPGFGPRTAFTVMVGGDTVALRLGDDALPVLALDPLPPPRTTGEGEVVFTGYGVKRVDGKDELSRLDLKGKVAVVVNGAPAGVDSATRAELEGEGAVIPRILRLATKRPSAIVVVLRGESEAAFERLVPAMQRAVEFSSTVDELPQSRRPVPLVLYVRERGARALLPDGWPHDDRPQALEGRRFRGQVEMVREQAPAYNVVAVVPGRDPSLRGSYVAFGAHYDHDGIVAPTDGDSVANGADDDGSGVVTLLGIARALHDAPPRRSALLVWHVGEEKGLYGSEWFTDHPTVPLDSIVAQLNADMIGRNAPDEFYVVGPNAAPGGRGRGLGRIVEAVNGQQPQRFRINREWDSPSHPEQIYFRSDHYNYARKGIPVVFFTTGLHAQYHTVDDEPELIDYDKLARMARLILQVGETVANSERRP